MGENKPMIVADNVVVSLDYTLMVDNQVIDSSRDTEPIEFLQGYGNIIPGLERELYGMKPGESKSIEVLPKDGYGERDPEAVIDIPRIEFPEDIPLQEGLELQMQNVDGDVLNAVILEVNGDNVKLDFNHPLAGRSLLFDVTVVALREATQEELEHGHVHSGDEDEEFEFSYGEEEFLGDIDEDETNEDDLLPSSPNGSL